MSHRCLTTEQVAEIKTTYAEFLRWTTEQRGLSMGQLARKYNTSHATIFNVIHGRNYNKPPTVHAPEPKEKNV